MSRRTAITALTGLLLLGASGAPAVAGELLRPDDDGRTTLCLRTDAEDSPTAKGFCVWIPVEP